MHDALDLVTGEQLGQLPGFRQIGLVKSNLGMDRLPVAAKEVIDRHDAMSGLEQHFHRVRADVTRAPATITFISSISSPLQKKFISQYIQVCCQPVTTFGVRNQVRCL